MAIATSVQAYLDREHVPYETVIHERTADSPHSAKAAHIPGDRLAKCVVLEDSGGYLMVILPATRKIDLEALYLRVNRTLDLANAWELPKLFRDCDKGAIPPLGQAYGFDCILDESLVGSPDVYFEAGDHLTLVHVKGDDFLRIMSGALRAEISQPI